MLFRIAAPPINNADAHINNATLVILCHLHVSQNATLSYWHTSPNCLLSLHKVRRATPLAVLAPHWASCRTLCANLHTTVSPNTATQTTSTTASINAYIQGAKRATLYFSRGDTTGTGNSGSTSFSVEVSRTNSTSDADWIDYNKLIDNVTNTNSQTLTRVGSASLSGTSTKMYSLDLENDNLSFIRCISVETTDGNASCRLETEF